MEQQIKNQKSQKRHLIVSIILIMMISNLWINLGFTAVSATSEINISVYDGNHIYKLMTDDNGIIIKLSWEDAKNYCSTQEGHLVTINSAYENNLVTSLAVQLRKESEEDRQRIWIGLTDNNKEGIFTWITGEPLTYINWNGGEPDNDVVDQDYVGLRGFDGDWFDSASPNDPNIAITYPFICEWDTVKIRDDNDINDAYELISLKKTWKAAKEYCDIRGGHLVTIKNTPENYFVQKMAKEITDLENNDRQRVWIGLTDEKNEGTYKWVTGRYLNYENWNGGEPDIDVVGEDYVGLRGYDGDWFDNINDLYYPFVCEWNYDSDGDDLPDYEEIYYETNRFDPDTDNDDLSDGNEIYNLGSDPKDSHDPYFYETFDTSLSNSQNSWSTIGYPTIITKDNDRIVRLTDNDRLTGYFDSISSHLFISFKVMIDGEFSTMQNFFNIIFRNEDDLVFGLDIRDHTLRLWDFNLNEYIVKEYLNSKAFYSFDLIVFTESDDSVHLTINLDGYFIDTYDIKSNILTRMVLENYESVDDFSSYIDDIDIQKLSMEKKSNSHQSTFNPLAIIYAPHVNGIEVDYEIRHSNDFNTNLLMKFGFDRDFGKSENKFGGSVSKNLEIKIDEGSTEDYYGRKLEYGDVDRIIGIKIEFDATTINFYRSLDKKPYLIGYLNCENFESYFYSEPIEINEPELLDIKSFSYEDITETEGDLSVLDQSEKETKIDGFEIGLKVPYFIDFGLSFESTDKFEVSSEVWVDLDTKPAFKYGIPKGQKAFLDIQPYIIIYP